MGTRGRISSAALSVVETGPLEVVDRLPPPLELTDDQRAEWLAIVNTMPADWFMRGNQALLIQLTRHLVSARRVAQMIEAISAEPEIDRREMGSLLKMQQAETLAINLLLRSMRLTQQSVAVHAQAKHPKKIRKPWEG